ncbi:universal stress protein [Paracoccus kondratievae]|jgi:nucleotide-binding universal stress UspA family protein|uniref:universal stress protein n=1 Tax=Alphaproteobacteria TaxID=28211 RepID=UPI000CC3B5FA|nr:universal stress protein [Paracoccus kondratievae]PKP69490.1 MAG: universal stress protein UspA [Alphaproteobacteria bacterium HGW-Alphaproteobacteria-4]QFQ87427.1 universal stress protein [Paracoccus kondratievae]
MTDKIIALVDGSIYSESVCHHVAWIAQRTAAPVELIHVLGRREAPEKSDLSGAIRLGARTKLMEELAEIDAQRAKLVGHRGRAILEDARAIVDRDGVTEITTRLRHGDIVEAIGEIEGEARVIVIGKRGEAADFAKGHLGSNLERIVRAAHRPVFVAARAFKPIESVLVAYDGGRSAMKAVDHISRSSFFADLPVTVVTVGNETPEVTKGLADAKALLAAAGIEAQTRIVAGQPDEELGKMVEKDGFGMLVMGAYGHSRIRSLVIGSTTTEMMRSCKVPVLLLR